MVPLICTDQIKCKGRTKKCVIEMCEWMEWALILVFKPEYNVAGNTIPFKFNYIRKKKNTRKTRAKKKELISAF